jgi:GH15 family glucan-1,4-alpha-glucosidase
VAQPIQDYALIGDCETAALVGRNGSIDWLCWPRFDSGAVFAALLGDDDNGHWTIAAKHPQARTRRRYLPGTLILETTIETDTGTALLTEFMSVRRGGTSHLVRIVQGCQGTVEMAAELVLRFDYGSVVPWVTRRGDRLHAIAGPDSIILHSSVPLHRSDFRHQTNFTVSEGQAIDFVMGYSPSYGVPPDPLNALAALEETKTVWQRWTADAKECPPYSEAVLRSLITLKALTYRPTGGIVAAPTTSLPERLGGERNWDYRFCWLRDATFTLLALINSGVMREAADWRLWLRRAVAGKPSQVQIMYGLAGERRLNEWEVPWLSGYQGAKPVRIGNAAATQLQLDIYGEVMDVLYQAASKGIGSPERDAWNFQLKLMEHLETVWKQPDDGLWEVRGGRRHFTHSKVMAWVAFDRAIRSAEEFGFEAPLDRWRTIRKGIHAHVCAEGYNSKIGAFVQSFGSTELDASGLLIALVGFLPPSDPRIRSTVEAIGRRLKKDGLVLRYDTTRSHDGLEGEEGAFLACSFWYADNLILLGRHDEARELFKHLLSLRNDVGLLSEEYDAAAGQMLGNFPQAFSHVALINTAHNLAQAEKPAEQRSGSRREPQPEPAST